MTRINFFLAIREREIQRRPEHSSTLYQRRGNEILFLIYKVLSKQQLIKTAKGNRENFHVTQVELR